jgi:hypothetical protein
MDSVDQVQRARIIAETTREIADLLSRAEQTEAKVFSRYLSLAL